MLNKSLLPSTPAKSFRLVDIYNYGRPLTKYGKPLSSSLSGGKVALCRAMSGSLQQAGRHTLASCAHMSHHSHVGHIGAILQAQRIGQNFDKILGQNKNMYIQ